MVSILFYSRGFIATLFVLGVTRSIKLSRKWTESDRITLRPSVRYTIEYNRH